MHYSRLKSILIIAGIFIAFIHHPLHAQKFELEGRKKQVISFLRVKNLIIIPILINGKGPYNFLLDTGVAQMIITDTTFLQDLDQSHFQTVKVQGYGFGEEVQAILTRDVTAQVGRATIRNIPTAIFKTDIFDLSSYLGVKIQGILGYYFFNSFVVKINYATNKITIYDPAIKTKKKGTPVPIEIVNGKPYMQAELTMPTLVNTQVDLLIDNGSSHPLMLESIDEKPFPLPPIHIPANLGVGINGEITGSMGRIPALKIKEFTFNNILSGFPVFNIERTLIEGRSRNGSLGADVLRHFLVTFDYINQTVYFKKSNAYKNKFDHDMSGLEIYIKQNKYDRFYIGRIESGSPAEDAGLKENDEIIGIDFKDVQTYTLNDLTEMFREDDGKHVIVEILRGSQRYIAVLKLKRRI